MCNFAKAQCFLGVALKIAGPPCPVNRGGSSDGTDLLLLLSKISD
jgi:hypothetical protein